MACETTAEDLIGALGLQPHPEGGWYRETFRDPQLLAGGRAASTAIYFLLRAGEKSCWHRVDAAEVWHWYGGAPLQISIADGDGLRRDLNLGSDIAAGERPQIVVPAGHWQQAASLGAYTLAGCTVAPGFTFEGFKMAPAGWEPRGRELP
jgi:predicted cupin superfamily sugar epimerase